MRFARLLARTIEFSVSDARRGGRVPLTGPAEGEQIPAAGLRGVLWASPPAAVPWESPPWQCSRWGSARGAVWLQAEQRLRFGVSPAVRSAVPVTAAVSCGSWCWVLLGSLPSAANGEFAPSLPQSPLHAAFKRFCDIQLLMWAFLLLF